MANTESVQTGKRKFRLRHRGRVSQVRIYLGKLLRMFIYQNDWKVLPMAALIAALVSMVIRVDFFLSMEGDLMGAFSMTCVAIWNGCFNSIQAICRERTIIKREHRSGMHITSYIGAHMIYQALLCAAQTVITLYVCLLMGVMFPDEGMITNSFLLDLSITIFLISYASDILSLWISSICHSTTAAMTVMPFVLIFQLVFSGGIFPLPEWTDSISGLTISNYGLKCIAAQSGYNTAPMTVGWEMIEKQRDNELEVTITMGDVLNLVADKDNPTVSAIRGRTLWGEVTAGEVLDQLVTELELEKYRDESLTLTAKVGQLLDLAGEDQVRDFVTTTTAKSGRVEAYESTVENVVNYWIRLFLFVLVFALFSVVSLEFIDKDRR